jgi:hypothetical protein
MTTPTQARNALIHLSAAAISASQTFHSTAELREQMAVMRDFLDDHETLMKLAKGVLAADEATKVESCETRHLDALFESVSILADHLKRD